MAGKNKNTSADYYPIKTMMNGVSLALFVAITVFFPFIMDMVATKIDPNAKYSNITITKKSWFIGIAVVGCIVALCAIMLSYSTRISKPSYKSRSIVIPERKGLPTNILELFSLLLFVFLGLATASQAASFVFFIAEVPTIIPAISFFICVFMLAGCALVLYFGAPRKERLIVRTDNAFKNFLRTLTLPDIAILLYWVCMFISSVSSDSPFESIAGLDKRNNGFFIQTLYIAVYFIISRGLIFKNSKAHLLIFSGTAVSIVSILHYFGIDLYETGYDQPRWQVEMMALKADRNKAGTNFLGSIGNINLLSYVIVICFVAAVILYVVKSHPSWDKHGIFTLSCCFVMSFGEKCTRTDAGIVAVIGAAFFAVVVICNSMERLRRLCISFGISALGWALNLFLVKHHLQKITVETSSKALLCGAVLLIAAGIIMTLFSDKLDRINGRYVRYGAWGVMVVSALAVCALAVNAAKTQTSGTFYEFGQMLLGNFDEHFGNSRGKIWTKSVQLIDENPLFGIGPDRFSTIFSEKLGVLFKGKVLDKAHNEYLDVLICNGIIGLGLFMTFLISLLLRTVRHFSVCPAAGAMAVVIFAYMVHAFFGYQLPLQSPIVWAVLGLAGSVCFASDEVSPPVKAGGK